MKLLTKLLEAPIDAFKNKDYVFHYFKPAEIQAPYAVWIEQSEESFWADNGKGERSLSGTLDFYTQTEGDSKLDELEEAMQSMGASWYLSSVQFEEDTLLIHFSWEWSVT